MHIPGNKFVITGGTSLIGSRIARELVDMGASEVVLFDNMSLSTTAGLDDLITHSEVTVVRGDVLRLDQLIEAAKGSSGLFAIAGLLTVPIARDPQLGAAVNIQGVLNTLEAARIVGALKVVSASSIAVYGSAVGSKSDEDTPFSSVSVAPPRAIYALTKLTGEQLGAYYTATYGLQFAAMRYSSVYGERQHDRGVNVLNIIKAYEAIKNGEAPLFAGDGHDGHDLVYVGDAARASVMAMADSKAHGPYNISSGTTTTVREMVEKVVELSATTLRPKFEEDASAASQSTHGSHDVQVSVSIEKAKTDFGWEPTIFLTEGVRRLMAWIDERDAEMESA
ncbi:NAD(P)-dependent oxidoreductase [Cryobacterium sp. Y62]|uniref:NAD-dependent epimerase/dehydratase family protein n=1 Tax=Cryobacterium sp. Y62 TaxID=2048284 RepID=UPI000CE44D9B|nr:GDP-mannose 4,6-dehydratase [Cryobacterium sp. Y62]